MSRIYEAVRKYIDDVSDELRRGGGRPPAEGDPDAVVVLTGNGAPGPRRPSAPAQGPIEKTRARLAPELSQAPVETVEAERLRRVALVAEPSGPAADRFRLLRLRLLESLGLKDRRRVLVTSALPQEGKSTVALNVAAALAEGGKRAVVLVDADLHHWTVSRQLGLDDRPGLAECLQSGAKPESAIVRTEPLGCYLLPAGHAAGNPTELLQSSTLITLLERLAVQFDWVVIDSPPVGVLTDSLAIQKATEGALLVVRAGQTRGEAAADALALLGRENVLAIVLNAVEGLERMYSKYSRYYRRAP